jgi:hypothetical protein
MATKCKLKEKSFKITSRIATKYKLKKNHSELKCLEENPQDVTLN